MLSDVRRCLGALLSIAFMGMSANALAMEWQAGAMGFGIAAGAIALLAVMPEL